ncbi:MAG: WD40 repeat domain-containing protein, partial [Planctomycetota bacterium]
MFPSSLPYSEQTTITRRSALAVALGGLIAYDVVADEPASIATRGAVQRVVRPIANQRLELKPISADFDRTIIRAIASDPRGDFVAVAGDDHAIRILSANGPLRVVKTLRGHEDLIRTLRFDPSGKRLVSAGNDGTLILWARDRDFEIQQKMSGTPVLACVRFAPKSDEMAAVGFSREVYLIGRGEANRRPKLECDCSDLRAVAYRDDGKFLAVAGRNGDLHLFDRTTGDVTFFKIHYGRVQALEFVRDSNLLISAGEDGNVVLFDTKSQTEVRRIQVTGGKLFSVTVLDGDYLAVAGSDNVIRIINIQLGRVIEEL